MADPGTTTTPQPAPGADRYRFLVESGVPQDKVDAWKQQRTQFFVDSGVPVDRIHAYWGDAPARSPTIQAHVAGNVQRAPQNSINDWQTAIAAGWDHSVLGLANNLQQGKPMVQHPGQPQGFLNKVAFGAGQLVGDLPTMTAGFLGGAKVGAGVGALAGAAVPGAGETGASEAVGAIIGGSVTGSAAAGALTEGTRQSLILAYKRNEIHTWKQAAAAAQDAVEQTGKVTLASAAGGLAGPIAGRMTGMVSSEAASAVADVAANTTANTAVAAALDHKVPDAEDFITSAALALAVHGVTAATGGRGSVPNTDAGSRVASNLQQLYVRTGISPWEAVNKAATDGKLRDEIYGQDVQGDPVHPKFRYTAPSDPEPFSPPKREFGAAGDIAKRAGRAPGETTVEEPGTSLVPTFGRHELETVGKIETGGMKNPDAAISPKGAVGRYQIMPATARQYGFDPSRLHEPEYNAMVSETILRDLNRRYHGDQNAVLIGYNAGPGRASQYLAKGPGTRLEATLDKTVHGGVRFEKVPASRDESFLPQETQEYLAKARLWGKGGIEHSEYDAPGYDGTPRNTGAAPESAAATAEANVEEAARDEREEIGQLNGGKGASVGAGNIWESASDEELTREMMSNIGKQPDVEYKSKSFLDNFGTQWISELTPFKRLDDRLVQGGLLNRDIDEGAEDAWRRASYGWRSVAGHVIRYGGVDASPWGENPHGFRPSTPKMIPDPNIPSFFDAKAMAEKAGSMDGWRAYMLAMRSEEKRTKYGIDSGFNPFTAAEIASRAAKGGEWAKYQEASEAFTQAQNGMLKFLVDTGRLSPEARDRMVDGNSIYVSWRRVQDDMPSGGRRRGVGSILAKVQGGDGQIIDPFLSAVDNAYVAIKQGLRNQATGAVIERLSADPDMVEFYGLKKSEDLTPNADEVQQLLKQYGLSEKEIEDPGVQAAWAQVIAERLAKNMKGNEFPYYNQGKLEKWTVNDPLLARAIRGVERPQEADLILNSLELATRVVRAGVTIGTFPVRMTVWHQFNQFVQDPSHPPPMLTFFRGFVPAISGDKEFQALMASGGLVHISADLTSDRFYEHMTTDHLLEETGFWDKAWNSFKEPMQWLEGAEAIATRLDAANRIGGKLHMQSLGMPPSKAGVRARPMGIDYAERGTEALVGYLSAMTAFWRPALLGKEQGYRAVTSTEVGVAMKAKRLGTVVAAAIASVFLPKMINYYLNHEADKHLPVGQRYIDLPREMRAAALITPPIAGQRFTFRLPANVGYIFGDIPERMMDQWMIQDKHAWDQWGADLMREFMGPLLPDFVTPVSEVAANHNWHTGRPLVPDSLKNLLPEDRYTENTSAPAKALAKWVDPMLRSGHIGEGFSPIMMDHLVTGWGDQIGDGALAALNAPMTGDTSNLKDVLSNVFVRGVIVRHPTANAQPLQDFYNELDTLREPHASARAKALADRLGGVNPNEALPAKDPRLIELERVEKAIGKQRIALNAIKDNPQMNLDEKRKYSEAIWDKMTGMAYTALHPQEAAQQAQGTGW